MDNADKFFRESHYNIIRFLLGICGLWPFHSGVKRCAIYLAFLLLAGSQLTFQILGAIEIWSDIFELLECLPMFIYTIIIVTKTVCMIYSISKIKILLIKIMEHWHSPKSDEETKILQSHTTYAKKFGRIYASVMLGQSIVFLSSALLIKFFSTQSNEVFNTPNKIGGVEEGIPFKINYIVDPEKYYIPIFLHTALIEISFILLLISQDILYMTFVQYCCGLLASLRYLLENILEFKNIGDDSTKPIADDNTCYSKVAYSIRRHTEVIQFIDIMESLFQLPLFIHMTCIICIISVVGYQMMKYIDDISTLMQHSMYLLAAVINVFFENWQGQRIIDYTEKVYEYAYNAQWYDMPNATRKLLLLIMLRGMKPSQLTAGKIIVMSYMNFNSIMRTSSSYFMLLRSFQ